MSDDRLPPQRLPKLEPPPQPVRDLLPPTTGLMPTPAEPPLPPGPPTPWLGLDPPLAKSLPPDALTISEPPKVAVNSAEDSEIRRLSPAEKAQRRLVTNAILFGVCIVVLVVVFYWLAR